MDQQQRFRSDLVEWLMELAPYGKFDTYIRKTSEEFDNDPNAIRGANRVRYIICTGEHTYSIYAHADYLGAGASTRLQRPGEDWTRGNDLPDGPFRYETWQKIKDAIIRYEMVKLEPLHVAVGDIGPPAPPEWKPTSEEREHHEARHALFLAEQRLAKAERVLAGTDKREPDTCGLCGGTADRPKMVAMHGDGGGQSGTCPQPIHVKSPHLEKLFGPAVVSDAVVAPLRPGKNHTTGFGPGASVGHRPKKLMPGGPA